MKFKLYQTVILSTLLLLLSCGDKKAEIQKETTTETRIFVSKAQFKGSEMELGQVEDKFFPTMVKANGMIDVPPENRAEVTPLVGGYIKTIPLLVGNRVQRGQALVTLENPDFVKIQQEYMEAKGQFKYLKSEFERQQKMKAENIISEKSYLQAESAYKMILARYTGLKKQLEMLHFSPSKIEAGVLSAVTAIYAPISGKITKVNISKGSYVTPENTILEIINTDHIHLELSVFEKDILKLKKGQDINFRIPETFSDSFKGEVYLIGSTIEANRTIKVHGHLKNKSTTNFLTGMFVEAEIITATSSAKALPETSFIEEDNNTFGLKLDELTDKGYYFIKVKLRAEKNYNGFTSIIDPEKLKGQTFLTKGAFNLIGE